MKFALLRGLLGLTICVTITACVNAYRAPPTTKIMSDCADYEEHIARKYSGMDAKRIATEIRAAELNNKDELVLAFERENERSASEKEHSTLDANPIIIRYSEGGDLVSRCDYNRALEALARIPSEDKTIFVYVHGWRNDSGANQNFFYNYGRYPEKTDGNDLARFKLFLRTYRVKECEDLHGKDHLGCRSEAAYDALAKKSEVIGIFVSWRGGSPFEYVDYWSRRSGADKLGRSGQIPRLLGAIENISRDQEAIPNATSENATPATVVDNKLIYIGHSMGARILFNSVAPVLISSTQDAYPTQGASHYDEIVAPFDLAIMINPALEAASYKAVDEFRYNYFDFNDNQLPLLITIQSEGDLATKSAFAFAEGIGWLNDPWQSAQRRRTIGHSAKFFQTHYLEPNDACNGKILTDEEATALNASFCAKGLQLRHCPAPVYPQTVSDYPKDCPEVANINNGPPPDRPLLESPFLVVRAKKEALDGHGWMGSRDDDFLNWFVEYVDRFNRRSEKRTQSRIVEAGQVSE